MWASTSKAGERHEQSGNKLAGSSRYHLEADMADVLIRDVPDEVIAALDARAGRLGLSRSEYVRRRLAQDAAASGSPVSVQDLARFAATFADLTDPDGMSQAWK
jgi:plasmid stability protein